MFDTRQSRALARDSAMRARSAAAARAADPLLAPASMPVAARPVPARWARSRSSPVVSRQMTEAERARFGAVPSPADLLARERFAMLAARPDALYRTDGTALASSNRWDSRKKRGDLSHATLPMRGLRS